MAHTLAIDCGGSGIKGSVLDDAGAMTAPKVRVATPYPIPPETFLTALREVADQLPAADRVTVGMPGMIRHGVVIYTPHYVTRRGPRSRVLPELVEAWAGYDARAGVSDSFGLPALVLNDAEVHGAGVVEGHGLELMLTLGTGLGCALFDGGRLAPHLEISHAPIRRETTFDTFIGDRDRKRLGDAAWSRRVLVMVEALRPVFHWDRLYLGGGNAKRVAPKHLSRMGDDVAVVPNAAGIIGGTRAWDLDTR
ncbi:MAG TPA: ROK family protein [Candidatus Limnocylindria bacterium]|nr:ROK family protein [Candidatus Limnocylindria bacterium]